MTTWRAYVSHTWFTSPSLSKVGNPLTGLATIVRFDPSNVDTLSGARRDTDCYGTVGMHTVNLVGTFEGGLKFV